MLFLVCVNLLSKQARLVWPVWVLGWRVEKWRLEKTGLRWSSSFISLRMVLRSSIGLLAANSSSDVEDRASYKGLRAGSSEKDNLSVILSSRSLPDYNYEIPLCLTVSHHRIRLSPGRLRMSSVIIEIERIIFSIRSDLCLPTNIIHHRLYIKRFNWLHCCLLCIVSLSSQNIFQGFKFHNWSWKFQFLKVMRMCLGSGCSGEFSLERCPPWSNLFLINHI